VASLVFEFTGTEETHGFVLDDDDTDDIFTSRGGSNSHKRCRTITDLICNNEDFSLLCAALEQTGLDIALDHKDRLWTLFAPTDEAFELLDTHIANDIFNNVENLEFVLLYHTVKGREVLSKQLVCRERIQMTNMKDTRTVCIGDKVIQNGGGNSDNNRPEIVRFDIKACNGIVHVVNQVILPSKLPDAHYENRPTPKSVPKPTPPHLYDTPYPTPYPTPHPTPHPTRRKIETPYPTPYPTPRPSPRETPYPTYRPTYRPTNRPSRFPTCRPTPYPTYPPTPYPTYPPTKYPTYPPTKYPTYPPTKYPTYPPTPYPTPYPEPNYPEPEPYYPEEDHPKDDYHDVPYPDEHHPDPYYPEEDHPKDDYYIDNDDYHTEDQNQDQHHPDNHDDGQVQIDDRDSRDGGVTCLSIADLICQTPGLDLLCEALQITNLIDFLQVGFEWTLFAPTNEAFETLINSVPRGTLNGENMADLLLFHLVETTVIEFDDLRCEEWVQMSDGAFSYTHCRGFEKFQVGRGNSFRDAIIMLQDSPIILREDIAACNGIIHTIDTVLLPSWWEQA